MSALALSPSLLPSSPPHTPRLLCRYQAKLAACSPLRLLDLSDMNARVPLPPLPAARRPPCFVLGGADDCVVDVEAVQELADYLDTSPVVLPRMAHDVMLDTRWPQAAAALQSWMEREQL